MHQINKTSLFSLKYFLVKIKQQLTIYSFEKSRFMPE